MSEQNYPHKDEDKSQIQRIGGYLQKVVPIVDATGKILSYATSPFQVELKPRDILQMVVGAYLLTVPVAFTEEVWILSEELSVNRVYALGGFSIFFVSIFIYFNFYRHHFKKHVWEFIKRVLATYAVSLFAVALFLTIIDKFPWEADRMLAIKRLILVTFPATMSATLSDTLK